MSSSPAASEEERPEETAPESSLPTILFSVSLYEETLDDDEADDADLFDLPVSPGGGGATDAPEPSKPLGPGCAVLPMATRFTREELEFRVANDVPVESAEEFLARGQLLRPRTFVAVEARTPALWRWPSEPVSVRTRRSEEWIARCESSFIELRRTFLAWVKSLVGDRGQESKLPSALWEAGVPRPAFPIRQERHQWMEYCYGDAMPQNHSQVAEGQREESKKGTPPLARVLLSMDNCAVVRVLKHTAKDLEERPASSQDMERRCAWLFGLLARLDVPCTADVEACLRGLLRVLAEWRPPETANEEEVTACVDTVRVVLERVFGQRCRLD